MKIPFCLLLSLSLFACSKDAPSPDTSTKGQLQGEWLPASPVTWTLYSDGEAFEEVYRGTTHQYRFTGDSVYVSVVGNGTGHLVAATYALEGNRISVWNDFAQFEVAAFDLAIQDGTMQWTATHVAPEQFTVNGETVETDSTRVVMQWKRR